jgi:hypothetical protein
VRSSITKTPARAAASQNRGSRLNRYFFLGGTTASLNALAKRNLTTVFAGMWIAAHSSLPMRLYSLAQSRNHELSAALDFFRRQGSEMLQDRGGSLLLNFRLFRQMGYHL